VVPEPSRRFLPAIAFSTFTDPGPDDRPFSCTVDYGDGGGAHAGLVVANVCVGVPHVYLQTGAFPVTVSVTDKDGMTGSSSTTHTVLRLLGGGAQTIDGPLEA
jgi:hypothetical protein